MAYPSEFDGQMRVIDGIDLAIQRVRYLLFTPFLFARWINFGIIIFLSVLLSSGGGFNGFSYFFNAGSFPFDDWYFEAEEYVLANFFTIIALSVPLVLIGLIIAVAYMYVRCRGTMMLIRAVALDDDDIGENWDAVRASAWSLFVFKLGIAIAFYLFAAAVGAIGFVLFRQMSFDYEFSIMSAVPLAMVVVAGGVVGIVYTVVHSLLHNFVAPLMFHFDVSCMEGWRRFRELARGNVGPILLFLLLKIVYTFVYGIAVQFGCCFTCMLGVLPVVHQILFSPFFVFERAYSLYVIGSVGPEYVIVREAPSAEPPPPPFARPTPPPPPVME